MKGARCRSWSETSQLARLAVQSAVDLKVPHSELAAVCSGRIAWSRGAGVRHNTDLQNQPLQTPGVGWLPALSPNSSQFPSPPWTGVTGALNQSLRALAVLTNAEEEFRCWGLLEQANRGSTWSDRGRRDRYGLSLPLFSSFCLTCSGATLFHGPRGQQARYQRLLLSNSLFCLFS